MTSNRVKKFQKRNLPGKSSVIVGLYKESPCNAMNLNNLSLSYKLYYYIRGRVRV